MAGGDLEIAVTDPGDPDVVALLEAHLAFAAEHSPPEDVHALDLDGLRHPSITFFAARRDGVLLVVGDQACESLARLRDVARRAATALCGEQALEAATGVSVGAAILQRLIREARSGGLSRVSLETGSMEAFGPARRMYARAGFVPCEPFGAYNPSRNSTFMTLAL